MPFAYAEDGCSAARCLVVLVVATVTFGGAMDRQDNTAGKLGRASTGF